MKEMEKKFFATLIVAVIAIFASYNIYQSQNTVSLSDLALVNVEALADSESSTNDCIYDPSQNCIKLHPTDPSKDQAAANRRW